MLNALYICFRLFLHTSSAVVNSQRDPAARAEPLCHGDRYQGDNEGEGVSCAADPGVAPTAEEETSCGRF